LISLSDDPDILVSRQVNDPEGIWGLVNKTRRALLPMRAADRPHPHFLAWYRSEALKS
jgi:putative restriction endonuclease